MFKCVCARMCDYVSGVSLSGVHCSPKYSSEREWIPRSSLLTRRSRDPFSDCQTGRIHESRVCACGQERELFMLPAPSAPDRNIYKQLWDSLLCVDDEAEQSIDFKHRKWEFPTTAKVRAANC